MRGHECARTHCRTGSTPETGVAALLRRLHYNQRSEDTHPGALRSWRPYLRFRRATEAGPNASRCASEG